MTVRAGGARLNQLSSSQTGTLPLCVQRRDLISIERVSVCSYREHTILYTRKSQNVRAYKNQHRLAILC